MQIYTLKVVEIRKEAKDVITVCFKQPGLKKVTYLPGQYLTLVFRINGRRYIRPYSFSSAPKVDEYLEVTVKRVPRGIVSNHINDRLKIDDLVEVMHPMGDFIFNNDHTTENKHIVLWGAGSGITPLMSIAKFVLHKQTGHKITLVYGNRHVDDVIFSAQIQDLEKTFSTQLQVWNFYTRLVVDNKDPDHIQGRIDPHKVLTILRSVTDLQNSIHYICGPRGLKESVKQALYSFEISEEQIFAEDFELIKDPAEFEDITTRHVKINIGEVAAQVEVVKGKSILEAGLDAFLELPYACQTGHCTVCKASILHGQVKMIGLVKKHTDMKDNECLTCCAYPLSDDVQLTI
ncbi:ferredoxin--NADP reductase [Mucilaginibacter mali]|uniref:Ferredoxin--NADP reductase n=1 Tax=Mucilaginibacter mali TaxID=2740462 RepID=A0A7D4TWJ5_9SPHI|nr:ferredoxin--NADP reductase [Mucilaginibacter mali]QKJ31495.1 ferredoxin--NADP reductase [Mucilaginibacter mali]